MNPITVNKLEKELTLSRATEIPGLTPPAGGWEAVQKKLNTGASAPAGPPGPTTLIAKPWWLLSLAAISLAMAAYLTLSAGENPQLSALNAAAQVAARSATTTTVSPSSRSANHTDEVVPAGTSVPTGSNTPELSTASAPETGKPTPDAAAIAANTAERRSADNQSPARVTNSPNGTDNQPAGSLPAPPPATDAAGDTNKPNPGPKTTISGGETPVMNNAPLAPGKDEADASATPNEAPETPTDESASDKKYIEIPGESRASQPALTSLPAHDIAPLRSDATYRPKPAFPASPSVYSKNGKLKVRPETQVHGGISGHYMRSFQNSRFYSRDVSTGGASRLFVLPNGEALPVRFRESELRNNLRRNVRLDVGISRQTSSGFLFRAIAGFYYGTDSRAEDDFGSVTGLRVREDYYRRELAVPVELGIQYTFNKRHRFRPYLGVNLVGYLHYSGVERYTFFDAQTQSSGLVSEFRSNGVEFGEMDISLTAGFQYKFTQRLSAGLNLYAHGGGSYFLESPFGFEVRYSLK